MAEYDGPMTKNVAFITATGTGGHRAPDRFATGDDNKLKMGWSHDHIVDGDISRYTDEVDETEYC